MRSLQINATRRAVAFDDAQEGVGVGRQSLSTQRVRVAGAAHASGGAQKGAQAKLTLSARASRTVSTWVWAALEAYAPRSTFVKCRSAGMFLE